MSRLSEIFDVLARIGKKPAKKAPAKGRSVAKAAAPAPRLAQGSRETVPGSNTGIMPEVLNAPYPVRQELDDRISSIIYDEGDMDRLAAAFKAETAPRVQGPGIYEGINPGSQSLYSVRTRPVSRADATADMPEGLAMDPASFDKMRAVESAYGLLTGQKAIAGNMFYEDVPPEAFNAFELVYGSPLDIKRAEQLLDLRQRLNIDPDSMAVVTSPEGVLLRSFSDDQALFDRYVREAAAETGSETPRKGFFHGMYQENPWGTEAGRYGQSYLDTIAENPLYLKYFDEVAPEIAAKLRREYGSFAKEKGMDIPTSFDEVLAAISGGGERELRDLIRKRGFAEGGAVSEDEIVSGLHDLLMKYDLA